MNALMESRLRWAEQRILDAVADAQCRDRTGVRPDRVGFARPAQVRFHWPRQAGAGRRPPSWSTRPSCTTRSGTEEHEDGRHEAQHCPSATPSHGM